MTPFEVGAKYAALDTTVHEVVSSVLRAHLPRGVEPGDDKELERLVPEDGELEAVVKTLEDNFGVELDGDVIFSLFAEGTVGDLKKAIVDKLSMKKTADHRYYMQHRAQIQQRNRQYRMRNLHQIRRHARIYRRKVKRRQVRPRRRVGSRGGGYTFIPR